MLLVDLAFAKPILIGVAEEPDPLESKAKAIVRILFSYDEKGWHVLDTSATQRELSLELVNWTITFDGKNIGKLISIDDLTLSSPDCDWCFPRDKQFRVKNEGDFPQLGNKELRFPKWSYSPQNRPLVLVSVPNFIDKEKWKPFKPDHEILKKIYPHIQKIIKEPYHCTGEPDWKAIPLKLTINDVELFRSYRNLAGEMIISAGLSAKHTQCDGPLLPEDGAIWFYVANNIKLIGFDLDLLDAADYDADGDLEFVFSHCGYNSDGYTLFDNRFEKRYDYYWSYH